jgi:hypothetical protein
LNNQKIARLPRHSTQIDKKIDGRGEDKSPASGMRKRQSTTAQIRRDKRSVSEAMEKMERSEGHDRITY